MSHINDHKPRLLRISGFTLAELMLATFITAFVFLGVLSAYIFLGRSLTRVGNDEMLESRTRLALYYFNQDVSAATAVTTATSTQLILTVVNPQLNPISPYTVSVNYTYDLNGNLTRSVWTIPPPSSVQLSSLSLLPTDPNRALANSYFSFGYYNSGGSIPASFTDPPTLPSGTNWIKQVSMTYRTMAGSAESGAQAHYTVVSSQVVMKNKGLLQ